MITDNSDLAKGCDFGWKMGERDVKTKILVQGSKPKYKFI